MLRIDDDPLDPHGTSRNRPGVKIDAGQHLAGEEISAKPRLFRHRPSLRHSASSRETLSRNRGKAAEDTCDRLHQGIKHAAVAIRDQILEELEQASRGDDQKNNRSPVLRIAQPECSAEHGKGEEALHVCRRI